jgi:hypothetical protein
MTTEERRAWTRGIAERMAERGRSTRSSDTDSKDEKSG